MVRDTWNLQLQLEYQASLKNKKQVNREQTSRNKSGRTPLNRDSRSKAELFSKKEGRGRVTKNQSSQIRKIVSGSRNLVISYGLVDMPKPKDVSHVQKECVVKKEPSSISKIIAEMEAIRFDSSLEDTCEIDTVSCGEGERDAKKKFSSLEEIIAAAKALEIEESLVEIPRIQKEVCIHKGQIDMPKNDVNRKTCRPSCKNDKEENMTEQQLTPLEKVIIEAIVLMMERLQTEVARQDKGLCAKKEHATKKKLVVEETSAEARTHVYKKHQVDIPNKDKCSYIKKEQVTKKTHRLLKGAAIKTTSVKKEQRAIPKVDSNSKQIKLRSKKENDQKCLKEEHNIKKDYDPRGKHIVEELRVLKTELVPRKDYISNKNKIMEKGRVSKKDSVQTKNIKKTEPVVANYLYKSTPAVIPKLQVIVKRSKKAFCIEEQNKNVSEESHTTRTPISSIKEKKGKHIEENASFSLEKDSSESKPVEINKPLAVVPESKKEHSVPHTPEGALDTFKAFFEKGKKEVVKQEKRVVTKISSLIKNACSEPRYFGISDPPVTSPKDNAISFVGKEHINVPKNKSCMGKFKSLFEKNEENQVTKKTPSSMGEAFSKFKSLVVSFPPVIVNNTKLASFVEKEAGKISSGKSGTKDGKCMEKFKSLFKLEKKEQIKTNSISSVEKKEDIGAKGRRCMNRFKSLFNLEKKVPTIQEDQGAAPYGKSKMEKFRTFFKISEKESPKLEEPRLDSKEKNTILYESRSFFNTENDMVSVSPPTLLDRDKQYGQTQQPQTQRSKKENENKNVQQESQYPQNPLKPRTGILKDATEKFCDIYQSQIEPPERQQGRTVRFLTPKPDRRTESKVTNESDHLLDKEHNEVGGFNPRYVPIEDSTYDSSLFDNTEYILKTVMAKILKNRGVER